MPDIEGRHDAERPCLLFISFLRRHILLRAPVAELRHDMMLLLAVTTLPLSLFSFISLR